MSKTNGKLQTLYSESGEPYFIKRRWDMEYDLRLNDSDIRVYAILEDHYRSLTYFQDHSKAVLGQAGPILFPSRQWIADRSGGRLTPRTVTSSIANLVNTGWLKVKRVQGKPNHYVTSAPTLETVSRVP